MLATGSSITSIVGPSVIVAGIAIGVLVPAFRRASTNYKHDLEQNLAEVQRGRKLDREEYERTSQRDREDCARELSEVRTIAETAREEAAAARSEVVKAVTAEAVRALIDTHRQVAVEATKVLGEGQQRILDDLDEIKHRLPGGNP